MSQGDPIPEPIAVKGNAAPVVMSESTKIILVAAFSVAIAQFIHSDLIIAAVLPATGVVAVWVWGVWHRLRSWAASRFMASQLPDDVAIVRRRKWWGFGKIV